MPARSMSPKAYAKLTSRVERMDRLGLPRFLALTSTLLFAWMWFLFASVLAITHHWYAFVKEGPMLQITGACFLGGAFLMALSQWIVNHRLIQDPSNLSLVPKE